MAESREQEVTSQDVPSDAARAAIAEEMVLNAAMAFAGQVATAAQQSAEKTAEGAPAVLQDVIIRQYLLETATLCLRRLGESYAASVNAGTNEPAQELLRDGARRADEARAQVEALGDLGLDLLDRVLEG